jgi:hypothetical protein
LSAQAFHNNDLESLRSESAWGMVLATQSPRESGGSSGPALLPVTARGAILANGIV